MSDGPYRSLPLQQHWRKLAERAERPAYSQEQVAEALGLALARELSNTPLSAALEVLAEHTQNSLFGDDPSIVGPQLEAARAYCRGSASGNAFIEGAIVASRRGLPRAEIVRVALVTVLEDAFRSNMRGIEEHYLRKAQRQMVDTVCSRIHAARRQCEFADLADQYLLGGHRPANQQRLAQRVGIDEGPDL